MKKNTRQAQPMPQASERSSMTEEYCPNLIKSSKSLLMFSAGQYDCTLFLKKVSSEKQTVAEQKNPRV